MLTTNFHCFICYKSVTIKRKSFAHSPPTCNPINLCRYFTCLKITWLAIKAHGETIENKLDILYRLRIQTNGNSFHHFASGSAFCDILLQNILCMMHGLIFVSEIIDRFFLFSEVSLYSIAENFSSVHDREGICDLNWENIEHILTMKVG